MNHTKKYKIWWITALVLGVVGMAIAGTTGKIAGRVTDAETGEPLPGANIEIEGTTMGAATDFDGYYVILNVPPGSYTLKASFLGYQTVKIENVRVEVDRTTEVNFSLKSAAIVTEEIVVTAKEPVIKKDLTASVDIVKGEEVSSLPVVSISEVVTQQAGVIERGGLHIRGGRPDEVVYVVDGVEVRDPYTNYTFAGVPLISMEETAINKGGFDVDQGVVSSGAINIVTKEGGPKYETKLRFSTKDLSFLGDGLYSFFDANIGDPYLDFITGKNTDLTSRRNRHRDKERRVEFNFGGPLFPGWRKGAKFFISGEFTTNKGRFPVSNDPKWRNWNENYQWKFSVPFASLKFFTSGFYYRQWSKGYSPHWRLALDHQTAFRDKRLQIIGGINHIISPKTYWELRVSYFRRELWDNVYEDVDMDGIDDFEDRDLDGFVEVDIDYFVDSTGQMVNIDSLYPGAEIHENWVELPYYWWEQEIQILYPSFGSGPPWWSRDTTKFPNRWGWGSRSQPDIFVLLTESGDTIIQIGNDYYEFPFSAVLTPYTGADTTIVDTLLKLGNQYLPNSHTFERDGWYYGKSGFFTASWKLTSQITKAHEILAGLEYKSIDIARYGADYASGGNVYLTLLNPPISKREGDPWNFIDWFKENPVKPWIFAAYLRDKIEVEGMVAKIGFRIDYYDPGGYAISDTNDPFVYDSLWGNYGIRMVKNPKKAKRRWYISPRIGVSHPISERDVLHFTYGHYFQIPPFYQIIRDYVFSGAFPIIGNADVDPEKTISYELGVKHAFTENVVVDVTAFYKDIKDWSRLKMIFYGIGGQNYSTYVNEDWGSVRGLEITFEKRPGGTFLPQFSMRLSYTFQVARGSFSSPGYAYRWAWRGYPLPHHESPLDWDQRHRLFLTLSYDVPKGKPLFNIKGLDSWGVTVQHNYGSGYPYTPPINTPREAIENINAKRLPSYQNTDMRFYKDLSFGPAAIRFFMDIYNLFNRKDLSSFNDVQWYDQFGDPEGEVRDPSVWNPRRQTRIGVEVRLREF
jgi:hypothetical protein